MPRIYTSEFRRKVLDLLAPAGRSPTSRWSSKSVIRRSTTGDANTDRHRPEAGNHQFRSCRAGRCAQTDQ